MARKKKEQPTVERSPEEIKIIERGQIWQGFWDTPWGRDLNEFFEEQDKLGQEAIVQQAELGETEKVKDAARKRNGVLSVKTYILDAVNDMNELLKEVRDPESSGDAESNVEAPEHVS